MKTIVLTAVAVSLLLCMLAIFPAVLGAEAPAFSTGTITEAGENSYTIGSEGYTAFISSKLSSEAGKNDLRIILAASLDTLNAADKADLEIRFIDASGNSVKSTTRSVAKDLDVYASATAAGATYTAAEGSVLFGIVINAVPNDAWDRVEVSITTEEGKVASGSNQAADVITPDEEVITGSNWMSALRDSTYLNKIAMPGTHDSGATIDAKVLITISGTAKCQNLTIAEQLEAGVRYFDIRLRRVNGALHVYHDEVDQRLTFDEVLNACYSFLEENPSEALIMCIKEEYDASGTNDAFDAMVKKHIDDASDKWYTGADIPRLRAARGKIVLMRRYATSGAFGFNASSGWINNSASFTISTGTTSLKVQDYYNNSDANAKWTAIETFFATMKPTNNTYYLNNTSGYITRSILGQQAPNLNAVAESVNPKLITYLKTNPDIVGIVATDLITPEIAELIYGLNLD